MEISLKSGNVPSVPGPVPGPSLLKGWAVLRFDYEKVQTQ